MSAARWNIELEEGCDFVEVITLFEDPECTIPVDVTAYGAKLQIRIGRRQRLIYEATVGNGITIPVGTDGKFHILIPSAVTAHRLVDFRSALYEFIVWPLLAEPLEGVQCLLFGRAKYREEIAEKG